MTAFILVVSTVTVLFIWWNLLLVQNHRILREMSAAANAAVRDPARASLPLALLMMLGILCSLVIVTGILYMFLRLIRAVQLNLAQSHFISAVTHELRSPVASLQILLETIRDPSTPAEKRLEFEACMHDDLRRLRDLVDQVLDTSRLEVISGKIPVERLTVAPLIRGCLDSLESRIKTTASAIDVDPFPPNLSVLANRQLLSSTLRNVLDNAMKYSPGPADVSIGVRQNGHRVIFEIRDKGIGISRKEQKRIFSRFHRAGDPLIHSRSGTGLGLYFAKLAMKAQGGKISVRSPGLGMGTTFQIELSQ